ncbi:alcohol dehydrogenase catalytic domain-containing protein [Devosia sp.]|uniref:alcohol dehydrogenase catalytic domain-containing protein n=1 Tax=Devosia sp. TaxID=1871048 RepID=UPI0025FF4FAE|nr:alcohol dehydrogenase catalytic domain-containing protein [Devosia sp.]MCR6633753.1 alcohol dehydrogenase catalytic domain-containing protein [Devosia sp.]
MIPTSTRAAVLTGHGKPLELTTLPLPEKLDPGAALVRIVCATLCGTDIEIWEGKMSFPRMLPMVLGHEMVGEIIALGGTPMMLSAPNSSSATASAGRNRPAGNAMAASSCASRSPAKSAAMASCSAPTLFPFPPPALLNSAMSHPARPNCASPTM